MKAKGYLLNQLNQFIPVVLGVYIGIVASNWNENRVKKADQNEFVKNLRLEVQANKTKLEESIAYRERIFLSGEKIRKELAPKAMEAGFWSAGGWNQVPGWEGLRIPTLEKSVHQSGIMANALSGLEFSVINSIARSYNQQEEYKLYAQKLILDNLTQLDGQVKTAEALSKLGVWHDVMNMERELIQQYQKTLEELKKLQDE